MSALSTLTLKYLRMLFFISRKNIHRALIYEPIGEVLIAVNACNLAVLLLFQSDLKKRNKRLISVLIQSMQSSLSDIVRRNTRLSLLNFEVPHETSCAITSDH